MTNIKIYDEIVNFIATANPKKVIEFRPSSETQNRLENLIFKEKTKELTTEEKSELDYYMLLEHLMRLAKARAHEMLKA